MSTLKINLNDDTLGKACSKSLELLDSPDISNFIQLVLENILSYNNTKLRKLLKISKATNKKHKLIQGTETIAKYNNICTACGKAILPGESIGKAEDLGCFVHISCCKKQNNIKYISKT